MYGKKSEIIYYDYSMKIYDYITNRISVFCFTILMKFICRLETDNVAIWDDMTVNEGTILESHASEEPIASITGFINQGIMQILNTKLYIRTTNQRSTTTTNK